MRIDRFYTAQPIQGNEVRVTDPRLLYQWRKVLRASAGYEVVLFDGSGREYQATIADITPEEAVLDITESGERGPITPEIWLYVGLIKRDKFEWIIEKATELGVAGIVPLDADRSQKKNLSLDRAQKIAIEASEQSGRVRLPEVGEVTTVAAAVNSVDSKSAAVLDRAGEQGSEALLAESSPQSFFIGPEGGWSEQERELFHEKGIKAVTLGEQNLKTETAAVSIAALALLKYFELRN